jgi:hypothetical protein
MFFRGPLPCLEFDSPTRYACDGVIANTLFAVAKELRAMGYGLSTTLEIRKAGADDVISERTIREVLFEEEETRRAESEASN